MVTTDSDLGTRWKPVPGFARYEVSNRGYIRHIATGRIMSTTVSHSGYRLVKMISDEKRRETKTVHWCVLAAYSGPRPDGMEACHGDRGKLCNWWPENLRWDTKEENERDKIAAGHEPRPVPTFECLNFATCGNLVINEGRRCLPCITGVGEQAAAMLDRGVNLMDVAEHFGYTGPDWVWQLAVKYGGCTLTKREALVQRPSLSQRVTGKLVTLRARRQPGMR